ncbi:hypothetical protein Nepgr_026019 [Nepenthes gracilis]|uniref:Uncharacterized protein n=1 Tax=Nepenthes gracilis TaxID=150966 RepID=A0AAD3T7S5_NEPGR|nr:hypothetical protein Nepgr_026019 [Nepenthes gracilis]
MRDGHGRLLTGVAIHGRHRQREAKAGGRKRWAARFQIVGRKQAGSREKRESLSLTSECLATEKGSAEKGESQTAKRDQPWLAAPVEEDERSAVAPIGSRLKFEFPRRRVTEERSRKREEGLEFFCTFLLLNRILRNLENSSLTEL